MSGVHYSGARPLHYVLDLWVHRWRHKRALGEVVVVRYADDFIVGCEHLSDAERLLTELRKRLRGFGLELHPEKTRLIEFGRYAAERRARRGEGKPETFNFLGFTHVCGRRRDGEGFVLIRRTMRQRMTAKLHELREGLRRRRHQPIAEQGQWLTSVIGGHDEYYAVPTNSSSIQCFHDAALRLWRLALRRRGQRRKTHWGRMQALKRRWLPPARIRHPWPDERFLVRTRARSRVR